MPIGVYPRKSFVERFWESVSKAPHPKGCWEWKGNTCVRGYGKFFREGKHVLAHRVAFELLIGATNGAFVCHACDNPACVNPSHLWLGTHADNMRDMKEKGRGPRGEDHVGSKLTLGEVEQIRSAGLNGESSRSIARRFCISKTHVQRILRRQSWEIQGV